MVTELLADREAARRALQCLVQLAHEVAVDALPAQRLSQPPALTGRVEICDRAAAVLESLREPRRPHRLLAQHIMRLTARLRIGRALRVRDRTPAAGNRLPVVAEMAVRMRELEEEPSRQPLIVELLHPRSVALEQFDGVGEPAQEVVRAAQPQGEFDGAPI